ncbi:hypothetical protein Psfp_00835 [Pelotomaculum sp. FP]|uniref:DUF4313 domain-containing protein n=1 Tax=Pelotomaculum sp. FP TaxID=261474 RepID=UPI0010669E89|nr:DUF4313 domain-containing protein [Pelotomaculum sp. FP]TEB17101.1 hypothetical protein Psfp_00835 [Pelotomaculum sp. FP]
MDIKTLQFNWKYRKNPIKLAIQVQSYQMNGNLYIGLWWKNGGRFESFTDLTVNLGKTLKPNETYVKTFNENEGLLDFILKNQLGTLLPEKGYSGFNEYLKIAFDMERLKEFDPDGVKEHMESHAKAQNRSAKKKSEPER